MRFQRSASVGLAAVAELKSALSGQGASNECSATRFGALADNMSRRTCKGNSASAALYVDRAGLVLSFFSRLLRDAVMAASALEESIGHAGDVVAHLTMQRLPGRFLPVVGGEMIRP